MRKYYSSSIGVGGASLLLIFVLLSFTTFATLSLISANADMKMVLKDAQAVSNYYEADSKAEEIFAQIKEMGMGLGPVVDGVQIEKKDEMFIISYSVPIDERRNLEVKLDLNPANNPEYSIKQWKTVVEEEAYEETLDETNLWDGEDIQVIP